MEPVGAPFFVFENDVEKLYQGIVRACMLAFELTLKQFVNGLIKD